MLLEDASEHEVLLANLVMVGPESNHVSAVAPDPFERLGHPKPVSTL